MYDFSKSVEQHEACFSAPISIFAFIDFFICLLIICVPISVHVAMSISMSISMFVSTSIYNRE